jgi:1-deoxy-D-xylulose-5-phosphate reductoisomerase
MKSLAVMGSTGSIGRQTLDLVREDPGSFEVLALGAHSNVRMIAEQAIEFRPRVVGLYDEVAAKELRALLGPEFEVISGEEMVDSVSMADIVINGVMGFAGLRVTQRALSAHKRLGLANKESLIGAGDLVLELLAGGGELIPVDSEHSAIFQALGQTRTTPKDLSRLVITASGGPFRNLSVVDLDNVGVADALAHPTWSMGPKISVDSSTLFNKGLEVIEAHYLFDVGYDQITVVVHPESFVHSMVEFTDGSTIAQLSTPDMRLPISLALYHPRRCPTPHGGVSWPWTGSLSFEQVDTARFPALGLAYEVGKTGGGAPCWMNAANEVAVEAFLDERVSWAKIYAIVAEAMDRYQSSTPSTIDEVVELDDRARIVTQEIVRGFASE